ncbi:DUF2829 domain-containing protein [Roseovarius atlanticus]|uniref:DUF2829 domain-containing protein n=1 Tax=Roseovarius atlanticus TaxID=1641875 RepID=UPI001C972826|nr:DUF2829 domain-containing protein [Roseovarius atlanticus]MBY5988194.1 DUF2829 domain-containing protein [Roseovarius atlanticus]MBY6123585.1 DUF2829 domain-containing protein [Roseovarius atlanticus]MBY6148080.1 DUF2829 domain-containing protein [Roseovarius atlanticus]
MQTMFFGTKQIFARPMTRAEYNDYRGWQLPADENGADAGFLVEYVDGGQANHPDHEGYISWSPEDVFHRAYQPATAMSFGHAIEAMKRGAKVARAGWNGKGMWIALSPGTAIEAKAGKCGHAAGKLAAELQDEDAEIELCAHIDMKAADGSLVIGWLASQTDMLAEDWTIVS